MRRAADLVLRNGHVITVDARSTVAQAIAIAGGRILAVGPDAAMPPHIAPSTKVIDLGGRSVVPGLIDGHAHMDREALRAVFPSLGPVRSIGDIQDRIAELARARKPGEWIVTMPIGEPPFYMGVPDLLAEKRWPTRHDLDAAAPDNPVYIRPIWGYWRGMPLVSCASTMALARVGIGRDTVPPVATVTIEKDGNGDPTGVFVEQEYAPIAELHWFRDAARFTHADRVRALPESARLYHGFGTTGVYEGHGVAAELLRAYREVHAQSALTMRAMLAISPDWKSVAGSPAAALPEAWRTWTAGWTTGMPTDDRLKLGGLFCAAGRSPADDARGAAAPYTGWAGFNSDAGLPPNELHDVLLQCARNDVRVATIGGGGGLGMLDHFEAVDRIVPLKGRRWVVAHINIVTPRDIERIARMGLVLTTHTNAYLGKALDASARALPEQQHHSIVPMKSLREAGVVVSLASDNAPISLWHPVAQTVTRRAPGSGRVIGAGEALSRMDALRCATLNGAHLTFGENDAGSLEAGKRADLAVLSADPLTAPDEALAGISAAMTMSGGEIVHRSPGWAD